VNVTYFTRGATEAWFRLWSSGTATIVQPEEKNGGVIEPLIDPLNIQGASNCLRIPRFRRGDADLSLGFNTGGWSKNGEGKGGEE